MIGDLLQILVLFACVVICFRFARREKDNLYLIYCALASAAMMISDVYFLVHSFLLEGVRIPFAANDIADFGLFLLLSTALISAVGLNGKRMPLVTAAAAVFAAANICLWIGWSGEWLRDTLGGLPFGYFVCAVIRSVYLTESMSRGDRTAMWVLSALLIGIQTATFFVSPPLKTVLEEPLATALMGVGELLLLVRTALALRRSGRADAALSLCFAGFCWSLLSMYMSAGVLYDVFSNLCTLHILLTLLAIRKKVRSA